MTEVVRPACFIEAAVSPRVSRMAKQQAEGATMREAETAYREARQRARLMSTVRLRWAVRSISRRHGWLTRSERAYLYGLRDELRARGDAVPA